MSRGRRSQVHLSMQAFTQHFSCGGRPRPQFGCALSPHALSPQSPSFLWPKDKTQLAYCCCLQPNFHFYKWNNQTLLLIKVHTGSTKGGGVKINISMKVEEEDLAQLILHSVGRGGRERWNLSRGRGQKSHSSSEALGMKLLCAPPSQVDDSSVSNWPPPLSWAWPWLIPGFWSQGPPGPSLQVGRKPKGTQVKHELCPCTASMSTCICSI